jgi:secretion/DNA translocation related CpaE-like protein
MTVAELTDHRRATTPIAQGALGGPPGRPPDPPPSAFPPGDDPPGAEDGATAGPPGGMPDASPPAAADGGTGAWPVPKTDTGTYAPVVLITADLSLTHRVEHLADAVGVQLLTVARPTTSFDPRPPLILIGHDALAPMIQLHGEPRVLPLGPVYGGPVAVAAGSFPHETWERAARLGAEMVAVLPHDETWLVSRMLNAAMGPLPAGACVVGVMGGRGGAGASVLAAALARRAAQDRHRTVLIDADPLGGGIDLVLGAEDHPGLRWADLRPARGVLDIEMLLSQLPVIDDVYVVTWDRSTARSVPPEAMRAVIDAAIRMADVVVIDLPRSLDRAATLATQACRTVLLVVSADVQASAAAQRSAALLRRWADDVRLVVRGPSPGRIDPAGIARALDLPLVGWLPREPRLAAALERAEPPALRRRGPLAMFCRDMVAELMVPGSRDLHGRGRRARGRR